ncbi:hypothetical protein F3Y22_tig00110348pilonHSYRG00195 [Hibiscus syriacus]|uniref:BTB/POZ domain-containing protein n=1 Tax=Hibiscus syriacus TaxID=106335 RepID=A0A6A3AU73_HIBSY|nr:hypothetical protein F3Y22_tig00110348pilonHSYRG00195 [Hibiscus syriacus]
MAVCCDLEVDVNGEETFVVHKEILCTFSGRLNKLLGKSTSAKRNKVIFHDFPGGAGNFELISRFCYNNGKADINPSNISLLYSAAQVIEMTDSQAATSSGILERCLDSLVGRLAINNEASPCASNSSLESPRFRVSSDTKSTESLKHSFSRATWWFLFYYQKSKFYTVSSYEKRKVLELVIDMLHTLDLNSISCKSLFKILRVEMNLNISKSSRHKLESMIGSQLDQATLDNLLIPSPYGTSFLYDVNLVLRILKAFLCGGDLKFLLIWIKKVGSLIDLYIAEVAPDPCLKWSKFLALVTALPDSARDSSDELYHAIDVYFEPKDYSMIMSICIWIEYGFDRGLLHASFSECKISREVQALISKQLKLKNLLQKDEADEQTVVYTGRLDISDPDGQNHEIKSSSRQLYFKIIAQTLFRKENVHNVFSPDTWEQGRCCLKWTAMWCCASYLENLHQCYSQCIASKYQSTLVELVGDVGCVEKKIAASLWAKLEQLCMYKSLTSKLHLKQCLYSLKLAEGSSLEENLTAFKENMKYLVSGFEPQEDGLMMHESTSSDSGRKGERSSDNIGRGRSKSSNQCKTYHYYKKKGLVKSECYKLQNKIKREAEEHNSRKSGEIGIVEEYNDGELLVEAEDNFITSDEWILDSGSSFHMSPNRDWFATYENVSTGDVFLGNNVSCNVVGIGTIKIKIFDGIV